MSELKINQICLPSSVLFTAEFTLALSEGAAGFTYGNFVVLLSTAENILAASALTWKLEGIKMFKNKLY